MEERKNKITRIKEIKLQKWKDYRSAKKSSFGNWIDYITKQHNNGRGKKHELTLIFVNLLLTN
jgi:hypothetical protein